MANRPRLSEDTIERLKKLMDEISFLSTYDSAVNYLLDYYYQSIQGKKK